MNGTDHPTGVEPADASSTDDPVRCFRRALTLFNETAKEACDLGEYKLQREAEDAAARCIGRIETLEKDLAARERLRSG